MISKSPILFLYCLLFAATINLQSAAAQEELSPTTTATTISNSSTNGQTSDSGENSQQTVLVEDVTGGKQLAALKRVLLRYSYRDCCPTWANLSANPEILDDLKREGGQHNVDTEQANNSASNLTSEDLLKEIKKVYFNITYLSIDGQSGSSEREQYYNYYDAVQYYLRLLRVAHEYLDETASSSAATADLAATQTPLKEIDFKRLFRRQLRSMEFKANRDPSLSSFITELLRAIHSAGGGSANSTDFDLYEDFIRKTKFGQSFHNPNITNIVSVMRVSNPSYLSRLFQ